jgi:hypothetical protein
VSAHGDFAANVQSTVLTESVFNPRVLDLAVGAEHGVGVHGGHATRDVGA